MKEIWIREEIKEKDHFCNTSERKGYLTSGIDTVGGKLIFTKVVPVTAVANFCGLFLAGAPVLSIVTGSNISKPSRDL